MTIKLKKNFKPHPPKASECQTVPDAPSTPPLLDTMEDIIISQQCTMNELKTLI